MSKPLAIAVFGVGPQAQPYLAALHVRNDVMVIAVGDAGEAAAKQAAAPWSARAWTDPVAMLREEAPDAFLALAPSAQLGDTLEQAVTQQIPFLALPPGVADWPAAESLQVRLAAQPLITAMSFPYRSADIVREAREFLAAQPLHLARGTWFVPAAKSLFDVLWNDACHLVDLLRFFLGEFTSVHAVAAGDAALLLTMQTDSGAVASLALRSHQLTEPRIELELPGEKWSLLFSENITRLHFTEAHKQTILRQTNQPHAQQLAAFLDALRQSDPQRVSCSWIEGVKTFAVLEKVRGLLARHKHDSEIIPPSH